MRRTILRMLIFRLPILISSSVYVRQVDIFQAASTTVTAQEG
jgi:hypothetical protein